MTMENEQRSREGLLGRTFVQLADSLVSGFDVVEMLADLVNSAVTLLDVAEAGLMLTDQRGFLRVMAASSERTRTIELLELQNDEGPCLECFRTGRPVSLGRPRTSALNGGRSSRRRLLTTTSGRSTPCRCVCVTRPLAR